MAEATNTTNPSVLRALADRCEREKPSRELDEAIARWFAHNDYTRWRDRAGPSNFTSSLDAAVTLVPEGWLLVTLSEIAGDGMSFCKLANTQSPAQEAVAFGSKALALDLCAAALRARAALADGDA